MDRSIAGIARAEFALPCDSVEETLRFFVRDLGFRLESIAPADDPEVAVLSGHGVRLRLQRGLQAPPGVLRLVSSDPASPGFEPREFVAPNGTRILFVSEEACPTVPPARPEVVVTRRGSSGRWVTGRAGMEYRDLIPGRWGGRYVASHIRIPRGGDVGDSVHYHRVRFQMIFCRRGWVRVVYEDQGPAFVLEEGDAVLQPPEIRHRVLECSPGLEVVELTCPARHPTLLDHDLELPTASARPERVFSGQRFWRHAAKRGRYGEGPVAGFEARALGLFDASGGQAEAYALRVREGAPASSPTGRAELLFGFVLRGRVTLATPGGATELAEDDAFAVPGSEPHSLAPGSEDAELLYVAVFEPRAR